MELLFAFQSKNELFLVMEYMHGGDCLSLLSSVKRLPEHVAQHFIAQVQCPSVIAFVGFQFFLYRVYAYFIG